MAHIMTFFNIPVNVSPKKVNNRQNVTAYQITTDVKKSSSEIPETFFLRKRHGPTNYLKKNQFRVSAVVPLGE